MRLIYAIGGLLNLKKQLSTGTKLEKRYFTWLCQEKSINLCLCHSEDGSQEINVLDVFILESNNLRFKVDEVHMAMIEKRLFQS